ncbi:MAG: hypothetical protein EXX96DRAFT_538394 [Benjaminiella poitrasii]|nr:MAG: hypothetical protein EXX96DRAFT_538394 [Benjaminiella poitrasii]
MFSRSIQPISITDLGLPNTNTCAFSHNRSLYIIGENNITISFGNRWNIDPPKIEYNNSSHRQQNHYSCSITNSGKLLLISSEQYPVLQLIDNIHIFPWKTVLNITLDSTENVFNIFFSRTISLSNVATVAFDHFFMIYGKQQQTSATFILDTRLLSNQVWYEVSITSQTPSSSALNSSLYATSRWILHFRTEDQHGGYYTTWIDCFDPYTLSWLGTVSSFNTSANHIQSVPLVSSNKELDLLLLIPSWSVGTSSSEIQQTNLEEITFWRLDISVWVYTDVLISPVKLNTTLYDPTSTTNDDNKTNRAFKPVIGGTVTLIADDVAVFYGGNTLEKDAVLQFFNISSLMFMPHPQWLSPSVTPDNIDTPSKKNNIAIWLGSLLGGLLFLILFVMFVRWFMKKRNKTHRGNIRKRTFWAMSINKQPRYKEKSIDSVSPKHSTEQQSCYVLSPIKPVSPIILFPEPALRAKPTRLITSRFREHFDYRPESTLYINNQEHTIDNPLGIVQQ